MDEEKEYFRNEHDFKLCDSDDTPLCNAFCGFCTEHIEDEAAYCVCSRCRFRIHKSCLESPRKIQHPLHPDHPLYLHVAGGSDHEKKISCDFCYKSYTSHSYGYYCSLCNFFLDLKCAQLLPEGSSQVRLPNHPHLLFFYQFNIDNFFTYQCTYCEDEILDGCVYVCLECKALLHKRCAELPREIHHPFHPQHPLTLLPVPGRPLSDSDSVSYFACEGSLCDFSYQCEECGFHMDTGCVNLVPAKNNLEDGVRIVQLSHPHPLFLFDDRLESISGRCGGCGQLFLFPDSIKDPMIYFCGECKWLHKSCAELPQKIKHPLDPLHPLAFVESYKREELPGKGECYACREYIFGFLYQCSHCKLEVDIRCASSVMLP